MTKTKMQWMTKRIFIGLALAALLAGATTAQAQDRGEHWEFAFGILYQLGADMDFKGGSVMETKDDFGLNLMAGYNLSDKLATNFGFQWTSVGYNADVIQDDDEVIGISGSYDVWTLSGNLIYNFVDGPVTPYVGAGIGYTWIDTGIPSGLPSTGCWWDPWYGYVCSTFYPTKTTDAFSYQAMLGIRYEFNMDTFLRVGYTSQWMSLGEAEGTPRFDVIGVDIGWIF